MAVFIMRFLWAQTYSTRLTIVCGHLVTLLHKSLQGHLPIPDLLPMELSVRPLNETMVSHIRLTRAHVRRARARDAQPAQRTTRPLLSSTMPQPHSYTTAGSSFTSMPSHMPPWALAMQSQIQAQAQFQAQMQSQLHTQAQRQVQIQAQQAQLQTLYEGTLEQLHGITQRIDGFYSRLSILETSFTHFEARHDYDLERVVAQQEASLANFFHNGTPGSTLGHKAPPGQTSDAPETSRPLDPPPF